MGRLIDADALCERIREIYDGYMLDEGCTPIEFENMVDEQPTAYDTDKVITKLETELKVTRNAQTRECIKNDGWGSPLQSRYSGKIEMLLKAIDIVRRGGVE